MHQDNLLPTLVIQLTHSKALKLLLDLEELQLIRVIKRKETAKKGKIKLSTKYAGKLSTEVGLQLQQHINQSRDEWERTI